MLLALSISLLLHLGQTDNNTYINGVCVDCLSGTLVPAAGSSVAAPLLRQLSFSFRLVDPDIEVNFVSQDLAVAMGRLQSVCRRNYELDFAALDYSLPRWTADNLLLSNDLEALPIVVTASVVTYNLPGVVPNVDPDLVLSRQNLYDIVMGNLTRWNDPRLVARNPLLASRLPNENIIVVLRTDAHGTAAVIQTVLANMDLQFKVDTVWPQDLLTLPNRTLVQGSMGVIAAITSIPFSLGFVSQSYVDEAALPDAQLENMAGNVVKAGEDLGAYNAVLGAIQDSGLDGDLSVADDNDPASYPLAQLIYVVYHTNVQDECDSRVAMAKFIHWMLTDPDSLAQIFSYPGFIPLPTALANYVVGRVKSLTCEGTPLLQETFVDFGNNAMTETLTVSSVVFIFIAFAILSTLSYKRNNRITKAAGLAFAFFFLLGCIFNYISVIFWASIPLNDSVCIGRYAFVSLGYALILGAMFAKCWEVSKIFYRAEKGDISPFKEMPWWMFCRAFFAVVFFEGLFLLIWLLVDPPLSITVSIDAVNFLSVHQCTTKHPGVWYSLHFIYFGIVLIWGAYLAYLTRDIWQKYNYPNESRSILMSIYNLGFCSAILVPLVTALDASPEVLCFLISVAILFPTTFSLVVVHGPKMLAFLATSLSKASKPENVASKGPHQGSREAAVSHVEMSHTVRILKSSDPEQHEQERELIDESERQPMVTPSNMAKNLDDSMSPSNVPQLGSTWKILTPADIRADSPRADSAFDTPEVTNPLFGENV